jgi:hypothetical protein
MACDCHKCEFLANPNRYDTPTSEWEPLYRAEKARADAAEAAVAGVLALHGNPTMDYRCSVCRLEPWPCRTYRALDAL